MTRPAPSVRVDQKDSPSWLPWLIGLLLVALLAVVLWFVFADDEEGDLAVEDSVSQGVVEDDGEVAPEGEEAEVEAPVVPEAEAEEEAPVVPEAEAEVEPGAAGPLELTPPFATLAGEAGRPVTAADIEVVDVPADEAFTIGTAEDELLVYITPEARAAGGSESAVNVEPGSTVTSLEGTLEPITDEFLSMLALQGDEADAVREREFYVAATAFELAAA